MSYVFPVADGRALASSCRVIVASDPGTSVLVACALLPLS